MVYGASLRMGDFQTQFAQALRRRALGASPEKTGRFGISFNTCCPVSDAFLDKECFLLLSGYINVIERMDRRKNVKKYYNSWRW